MRKVQSIIYYVVGLLMVGITINFVNPSKKETISPENIGLTSMAMLDDCRDDYNYCRNEVKKDYDNCVKFACSGSNSSNECRWICQIDYERDMLDCREEYNNCR